MPPADEHDVSVARELGEISMELRALRRIADGWDGTCSRRRTEITQKIQTIGQTQGKITLGMVLVAGILIGAGTAYGRPLLVWLGLL